MVLSKQRLIETVSIIVIVFEVFVAIKIHADIGFNESDAIHNESHQYSYRLNFSEQCCSIL